MLMFVCAGTCTICSCSKDVTEENTPGNNTDKDSSSDNNGGDNSSGNNGENLDIHVIVNEDGTTSNGSIFSAIDNQNFYVDYIKYTVTDYYLSVSGYDKTKFNGVAKIISKLTYKGHTFEVLEIGDYAFNYCRGLTSVTIPNSVTRIGVGAFGNCSALTSVTMGNSVTSIGEYAFHGCTDLTSVTIPNSVTSIGEDAFYGCSDLTSVHITDLAAWCKIKFVTDDSNPLYYVHHLYLNGQEIKDLVIPNSVTSISKYAFYGCTGLTSVTIPNSVTSIGNSAFSGCTGLTSVHITDLAAWCKIKFDSNPLYYAHHLYMNGQEIKNLVIPNSVTDISDRAFYGCTGLISVTIPNSVTSIGSAFWGCTGLTSVTIPNSVTSIGEYAFYGCTGLTSITIPNSVTDIGEYAFRDCTGLTDVWCYAEEPPYAWDAFDVYISYNSPRISATLHVPAASLEKYRAKEPWKYFFV